MLVKDDGPAISDALVVLRGDADYSRAATAASLYAQGFAPLVFVSTALRDKAATSMAVLGVEIPREQDLIRSVLLQLGVPGEAVVLDASEPGGGTLGEAKRIRAMAETAGCRKILVVTSWFHTRRTASIMRAVFAGSGREVRVVGSLHEDAGPDNWWHFRYEAVNVLLEYAKWAIWLASPTGDVAFGDNPAASSQAVVGKSGG